MFILPDDPLTKQGSMSSILRNLAAYILRPFPLSALTWLMPREPIGFYYHTVSEHQLPYVRHLYTFKTPGEFERDLESLCQHFTPVAYGDLQSGPNRGRSRRPAAVVTFDDGLRECYHVVRPLLLKRGIPAIFFVTTDFLDNRRLFYKHKVSLCIEEYTRQSRSAQASLRKDLAEVMSAPLQRTHDVIARLRALDASAEACLDAVCARLGVDADAFLRAAMPYLSSEETLSLAADGFTIGAHSCSHVLLASMTPSDAEADIVESCALICKLVEREAVPYAFPFHGRGVSRALLRRIREAHQHVGLFFDTQGMAPDSMDVVRRIGLEGPPSHSPMSVPMATRGAYAGELKRVVLGLAKRQRCGAVE